MKDHTLLQVEMITKEQKYTCILIKFKNLLQNHWTNFNQTWHKASFGGVKYSNCALVPSSQLEFLPYTCNVAAELYDKVTNLKLTCYHFENIKCKTKFTLLSNTNTCLFTGMNYLFFHYFCWTALVYKYYIATKQG
mgnify:CR=1 FL=1